MLSKLRPRSAYDVMAGLALFLTLTGGTAVALSGTNTVFTDDIAPGQVKEPDIGDVAVTNRSLADNAVTSRRVLDNSLSGLDLKDGSLKTADIGDDAVIPRLVLDNSLSGLDVKDNSLKGADIDESSLTVGSLRGPAGPPGPTFASFGTGIDPAPIPNRFLSDSRWTFTTPAAGRLLAQADVKHMIVDCTGASTVADVGLYVDGTPVPGTRWALGDDNLSHYSSSGVTPRLPAGSHTVELGFTCGSPVDTPVVTLSTSRSVGAVLLGG